MGGALIPHKERSERGKKRKKNIRQRIKETTRLNPEREENKEEGDTEKV